MSASAMGIDWVVLGGALTAVLSWLAAALVYGSLAAILAWGLARTLLRGAPVYAHVLLWLVVLIKFVVPQGPSSSLSLATLIDLTGAAWASEVTSTPVATPAGAAPTADGQFIPITRTAGTTEGWAQADARGIALTLLALGYLLGVGGFAAVRLLAYTRFVAKRRGLPPADAETQRVVATVAKRLRQRIPDTRLSDDAPAPYVYGTLRPTLVLSPRQLDNLGELEAVVTHELAHLRRGDLWVRLVQWLAGTLLFFWPVVAWVNRRLDLAREQTCDEWALRHGPLSAGQYARCLLKAAQPGRAAASYLPAAMASNFKHVERRIEMILSTNRSARRSGVVAGGAVLAWAGFVLTGAAKAPDTPPAPQENQAVQVVALEDGACHVTLEPMGDVLMGPPFLFNAGPGMMKMFVHAEGDGATASGVWISQPTAEQLADFSSRYPAADTDADGVVTPVEHDAYFVALAMSDPAAVLGKFPKADRNADQALQADEAARFVVGGLLADGLHVRKVAGDECPDKIIANLPVEVRATIEAARAANGGAAVERVMVRTSDGATPEHKVVVLERGPDGQTFQAQGHEPMMMLRIDTTGADDAPNVECVRVNAAGAGDCPVLAGGALPVPPTRWLAENVTAALAPADVARYLEITQQAPLKLFLELNPDSDANHDGQLSPEERDAFVERHNTAARARMLERFPAADANGDGLLTNEELHEHLQGLKTSGAK